MINSISCEILYRRNRNLPIFISLMYLGCIVFTYFLAPTYRKGRKLYDGLLTDWNMEDCIPFAIILRYVMLFGAIFIIYGIFKLTLSIRGEITINNDEIKVDYRNQQFSIFPVSEISNLFIQFNYIKKNDIEPRNMVSGNNNIIAFKHKGKSYRYEFLLQTLEEDESFRAIMDYWTDNNIAYQHKTVLTDF
ncbi:MAG: hypothetical protein V4613_08115 [Bacteroidota bacterium]